jgi:serine/threonine-protein kinase HipA
MKSTLQEEHFEVRLYGRCVGLLHRHVDYTWLTFAEGYIANPHRAILGMHFENNLRAKYAANSRLPSWFSNLLPEGDLGVWIADERNVPISREMELLAHVGHDLPGAVQVFETDDVKQRASYSGRELVANHPQPLEDAAWRFSLAGVGMKFSMLAQDDRFTAPAVG